MRTREFKDSNYKAIYFDGKTIRIPLNPDKPISELKFPEFYDVKICSYCEGNCPWCYMDSNTEGIFFDNVTKKIEEYFGAMSENERPFQVAIGGGEPTSHPDFISILQTFSNLGIRPNFTTNGMIKKFSSLIDTALSCNSAIAISCHPHLMQYWKNFANICIKNEVTTNLQFIISDKISIDYFKMIYTEYKSQIDYFILLPHVAQGRGIEKEVNWEYLLEVLPKTQIAFGANFYSNLCDAQLGVSLYEPEILSKFLDLSDMSLHKSSFNLNDTY